MQRERALFISRTEALQYLSDEYQRLYFGDEFCERLLPTRRELEEVMALAADRGLAFTLVTPYVTEAGLKKVSLLAERLPKGTEVVFNDWGVFRVLKTRFPNLLPVMGRLLTKIKRGPRIAGFLERLPSEALAHLRRTNLGVPVYQAFLKENGIRRAELDHAVKAMARALGERHPSWRVEWLKPPA